MSLLLCRLEPVKHPFVVAELGVRLFSSQELCYVIYENPLLVMEDFVDERLIQFIREDLDMDFLAGKLENWKKSGEEIPIPTPLANIETQPNERAVLIDVYMPSVRQAYVNRSINRTVTLPAWLNAAALERNINFSQVLQDALKAQLHLG